MVENYFYIYNIFIYNLTQRRKGAKAQRLYNLTQAFLAALCENKSDKVELTIHNSQFTIKKILKGTIHNSQFTIKKILKGTIHNSPLRKVCMNLTYIYLTLAIFCEVAATVGLKSTEGFSHLGLTVLVLMGYGLALWFLSLALSNIPIGVAYATWSGLGIVLVALVSMIFQGQQIDLAGAFGMALIIAGVMVLHLFSGMKVD